MPNAGDVAESIKLLNLSELAAIASVLGKLPSPEEYLKFMEEINPLADDIYRYLNFNEIDQYVDSANAADIPAVNIVSA